MKKDKKKLKNKKKEIKSFEGVLSITSKGFGFVDISKNNGIYVSADNMNGGYEGDFVRAKMVNTGRRPECKIIEIMERGIISFTGIYENKCVVPYSSKLSTEFKVKKEHVNGASDGDLVVCDILSYPEAKKVPYVYIREVLGSPSKKGNDVAVIMHKYGISGEFPEAVQIQNIDSEITEEELSLREDFTNRTIITIDGDDAKDLDDAVSVEARDDSYILGVHIADVSHYVKARTAIDMEAYYRGTSVYLPDRVSPMLPQKLSNDLCSLNPNELKLTLSCIMTIDKKGKIISYRVKKTYIKTVARMSYENVKRIIEGEKIPEYEFLEKTLADLHELYKILREKRKSNGFIEFNFPESKFIFSEDGKVTSVFPHDVSFSNEMIEEFMLAANVSVADFAIKNELPFVYRVHGQPDSKKIESLYSALRAFGITIKAKPAPTPKELGAIIRRAQETEFKNIICSLALRSMQKAIYSHNSSLHYGLNFKKYCHFTSPIRRYPDLVIHRIISEFLAGKSVNKYKKFVVDAAIQSSETEVNAFMCEREVDDLKKAEYMSGKIGEVFSGYISGMVESGFFVSLPNTVEGFVPLALLSDDYYEYKEDIFSIVGRRRKNAFKLGQEVEVKLSKVDISNKKIDFVLI